MHNYAPKGYMFKNAAGLCMSFSSSRKQEHSFGAAVDRVTSQGPPGVEACKSRSRQEQDEKKITAAGYPQRRNIQGRERSRARVFMSQSFKE